MKKQEHKGEDFTNPGHKSVEFKGKSMPMEGDDKHKLDKEMVTVKEHQRSAPQQSHPAKPKQPGVMRFIER